MHTNQMLNPPLHACNRALLQKKKDRRPISGGTARARMLRLRHAL
jgi:hypothetical protein